MKQTFIYALLDPNTLQVRYIGKSNNPKMRMYRHVYDAIHDKSRTHKNNWVRSLVHKKQRPIMQVIECCDMAVWQEREKYYIAFYGKANLLNVKDGGDGTTTIFCSADRAAKISKALKGRPRSAEEVERIRLMNVGRKHTAEVNKQNSIRNSGERNANYGKPRSDATKDKIRKALLGQIISPETRDKIGAASCREVLQYNIDGIFIASYFSLILAEKNTGVKKGSISHCINGRMKLAGGYIWKRADQVNGTK